MYEFLDYRVCDAMTAEPVTIGEAASLREAETLLDQHGFNALPVVGPGRELRGIVTKLDLLRAFRFTEDHMFPPYEEIMARPVREVMVTDLTTVTPRTTTSFTCSRSTWACAAFSGASARASCRRAWCGA